ncbi:host specificity protein [Marivivens niveibacter]|uniref:Host specificity protein n=1 Tax=Marivivens niveibacter TaxID=1930667 RepID=A0A251X2R7_9RHOB|nr:glycoside hydrolase TIM-barrel-like domain-containing protein [Marivivens niveibacter]OUD10705.1 host specificity protein [Marivivens niveibacter]
MATIVLSAVGMAIGGSIGGTVLGISSAVIGRAAGAMIGQAIDQRIMGSGSGTVSTGQIDRFRLTTASEGDTVSTVYGRYRVGGHMIWATRFIEDTTTTSGGKGGGASVTEYAYRVSLALALCDGEITSVGRIWADGTEVPKSDLNMRIYKGTETQLPDPKMEAVEGYGMVPAYRGISYVVIEDLDLSVFGNRIPQFSFEVTRPAPVSASVQDIATKIQGVALIPGTGEYALATTPLTVSDGLGAYRSLNINSPAAQADINVSLDALVDEVPNARTASLIVSWFGNDLRCGECRIGPRVEQADYDPKQMPWTVSGATRSDVGIVPLDADGRALYGGTPTDQSVVEAIQAMRDRGISPVFYPFILMEQLTGNGLPDPWGAEEQPAMPWRGRITTALAPYLDGTSDKTAAAKSEVDAFFGTATVADFAIDGTRVVYTGPDEWSYRRFILHYAHLCAAAGGVDAFCIGSELRSLTQIRDDQGFPAVDHLCRLAAEVRSILGTDCKIGYAADWSEYHGYQPVGTADKYFHLDPLWADENIDFIGVDNYVPLSDWRDGNDHLDADWGDIRNIEYLKSNIEGGEYYDWYYHSTEARDAQIRTAISDGDGEPWVWRAKDMRGWWSNYHHNRVDGQRQETPTAWQPKSKPIWFTEYGCAAIDKGTNQPNKFLDPKSSESQMPHYSNGARDDALQAQYILAMTEYYAERQNNPVSAVYGGDMVDMSRALAWAWDTRPYPFFPQNIDLWSDGENYGLGHWLNGRVSSRSLASVVTEICHQAGMTNIDTSALYGTVRGYVVDQTDTARAALQPLMLAYGFDAVDQDGLIVFKSRNDRAGAELDTALFAVNSSDASTLERIRASEAEMAGTVRLTYVEADGDYQTRLFQTVQADDDTNSTSHTELPLVLTSGEAEKITERWLVEAGIARESVTFALPPSASNVAAGDSIRLDGRDYRVTRKTSGQSATIEAQQYEPSLYKLTPTTEEPSSVTTFVPPVPVDGLFLDLPILTGEEAEHAPYFAAVGAPWPGPVALYHSNQDANYKIEKTVDLCAIVGITETDLAPAGAGRWDRGAALRVKLVHGALSSASAENILSGANVAFVGDGTPDGWEAIQFVGAKLVGPQTYDISMRLRGQLGTDHKSQTALQAGAYFVLLNDAVSQIDYAAKLRGVERFYRFGPASRPMTDTSYQTVQHAFAGVGLRPYPVCHMRKSEGADQSKRFSWIRRTRIDGDSWDGPDVPLGEETESYRIRIFRDGEPVRELVTATPSFDYDAGSQAADSGADTIGVAQLSARFGPGPETYLYFG